MKFVLYTSSVSAHQLPLAREIARMIGADNFRYIYTGDTLQGGGQEVSSSELWIVKQAKGQGEGEERNDSTDDWLGNCDVLLVGGLRPIDLMERRVRAGKMTLYMAERWFKPIDIGVGHRCRCSIPGWVRLLHPAYFKMAKRFVRLFESPHYRFLPIGPHSARDMRLLCRFVSLLRFHLPPPPQFIPWGYFVEPSGKVRTHKESQGKLRILWVGRMIGWKRVDTIIRAILSLDPTQFELTLVGSGNQKDYLVRLSGGAPNIVFRDAVPIGEIREIMRQHDVYVLSSNEKEGWGAALNEAIEEGLNALGTYEAGASSAMLPESHLFHAGDWRRLAVLLKDLPLHADMIKAYTAAGAVAKIMEIVG